MINSRISYIPGKATAGNYSEYPQLKTLSECVQGCCQNRTECNVAFMFNATCFHIQCISADLCYPVKQADNATTTTDLVVVNPIERKMADNEEEEVPPLRAKSFKEALWNNAKSPEELIASTFSDRHPVEWTNGYVEEFAPSSSATGLTDMRFKECELGIDLCGPYEACYQVLAKSRQGICSCIYGYTRNADQDCVPRYAADLVDIPSLRRLPSMDGVSPPSSSAFANEALQQSITVSVASKDVQLPEKEAVLSAYTIPDELTSGDKYDYAWSLISQPSSSNGTISDQTKDKIMLSNLSEGVYRFKVRVSGQQHGASGEAEANLTVLPEKRTLKPPQVTINPQSQTLRLPNSQAILDGSSDNPENEIVNWHWTLSSGPIGYETDLPETNILQLTDLKVPGNYTFKLTLTDSNGAQNSSSAVIYVLKGTDYPPEANAVPNVMVRLPHNSLVLNGSQSTDDRGIVSWEWIKDLSDPTSSGAGAVDMQDTRTPFLKLSNLEEGTYRFILKVTDGSGQSSNTSVLVFVKPPLTSTPTANAGVDREITLPVNTVLLNGSKSCESVCGVVKYEWRQKSGPSQAELMAKDSSTTNASKLTVGEYVFELMVTDEDLVVSKDRVKVTVVHVRNTPPLADAGGDQSLTMPLNVLTINGSKSSDDLRIVRYSWTRERSSLAAGDVVSPEGSAVLAVANLIPGRYVFKLTVTDDQGATGDDVVRVIVHPDPNLLNLVDLTMAIEYTSLTQSELEIILQKISLFLGDNKQVHVRSFKPVERTVDSTLRFCVEDTQTRAVLSGVDVEREFKKNLVRDAEIFGVEIIDIRTVVCQNNCSGRGRCDEETRQCVCNTFWATDLLSQWQMGGVSNCGEYLPCTQIFTDTFFTNYVHCNTVTKISCLL